MEIKSAQFVKGAIGGEGLPEKELPQIAFVGRSNVGKSSVINSLVGMKDLAISSSIPGRTLQLNFFLINEKIYFVDLPGYGYSKQSLKFAEKMRKMIMWYLQYNESKPKKVVLIIDGNVGPTKFDLEMLELLQENEHDVVVVANKMDKVKNSELHKKKKEIVAKLNTENIIYFSSKTKMGREELLDKILN
jgi:GTP-binding protein